MIGIYRIKNIINNKCYYGSSKNINRRWQKHKSQLKHNKHENIILQRAWNKYGENFFIFEIVEECDLNDLLVTEQKYLDLNPEYNIGRQASGGDNLTEHPNKNDIIKRRKDNQRIVINKLSEEDKKKRWSRPKEINGKWKGGISINYCSCGKEISYGSKFCMKCLPRNDENNPFYNKHHTNETKILISESKKGKYFGNQNIKFIINNIEYESLGDASKKLNIPITTIRWRLKSKNKKFINYKYI